MLEVHGVRLFLDGKPTNFDIRELVPKEIYQVYGAQSIRFLQEPGIKWLQFSRDFFDAPHYLNNWHRGGHYNHRGYRPPLSGFYNMVEDVYGSDKLTRLKNEINALGISEEAFNLGSWVSMHKFGGAFDYTVKGMTAHKVRAEIKANETEFIEAGLTTIESGEYAPTWVHGDNRPTGLKKLLIVSPAKTKSQ